MKFFTFFVLQYVCRDRASRHVLENGRAAIGIRHVGYIHPTV
ncbi:hypothetical protein SSAG_06645 [Streptomyces sp. Mg1]|nr:hypothetical protein SSAG_06645 [Streptomyces sp. Mg1]